MTRRVRNGAGFVGARSSVEGEPRRPSDYYPTIDADVTRSLVIVERRRIEECLDGEAVDEPACGEGHMVRVIESEGFEVKASDIEPRGRGRREDYLRSRRRRRVVITNPPFSHAIEFIEHSMRLGVVYLGLLLKSDFWQVGDKQDARRHELWRTWPPTVIYPLTWRPDFTRGGSGRPFLNVAWNVWVGRPDEPRDATHYKLLSKDGLVT